MLSVQPEYDYDVFISYSHAKDNALARVLQVQLQRYAKPWYRLHALKVFRDETDIPASPGLWAEIERALSRSRWLLLLASPESAGSRWVRDEIDWWLANRSAETILLGWTGGNLEWDDQAGKYRRTALAAAVPDSLAAAVFPHQPRHVDLRLQSLTRAADESEKAIGDAPEVDWANIDLGEQVVDLAAPIRGTTKSELLLEHRRRKRQFRNIVVAVVASLCVLLTASLVATFLAVGERNNAVTQRMTADSRRLVAQASAVGDTDPDLARQLLAEAYRQSPTAEVTAALLSSPAIPQVLRVRGIARGMAMARRRDIMAVASDWGISVFDTSSGARLAVLPVNSGYTEAVAFDGSGRMLAAAGADGTVRLYDMTSPEHPTLTASFSLIAQIVAGLAFAGDSRTLLVQFDNGALASVDVRVPATPRLVDAIPHQTNPEQWGSTALTVSPDGTLVAFPSEQDGVRIVRVGGDGRFADVARIEDPRVTTVAFSSHANLLAAGGNDDLTRLWDVTVPAHPVLRSELGGQALDVNALAFSHASTTLAVGAGDGTVQLWDIADPFHPVVGARLVGTSAMVNALSFTRDDRTLASAEEGSPFLSDLVKMAGLARLWPVDGDRRSAMATRLPTVPGQAPSFGKDGSYLATGSRAGVWEVSDPAQAHLVAAFATYNQGPAPLVLSPDGRLLASGVPLKLWDIRDIGHPRDLTPKELISSAGSVAFDTAGSLVAMSGANATVQVADVATPTRARLVASISLKTDSPKTVVFRPGSKDLAILTNAGAVQLWDVARADQSRRLWSVSPAGETVKSVAFSPDGTTMITGSNNGTLRTWDLTTAVTPKATGSSVQGNTSIDSIAYDPREPLLATSSNGGPVMVWLMDSPGHLLAVATLDTVFSDGLSFSPNGRLLAADTSQGTEIWDTDVNDLLSADCARSTQITASQWAQYLPGQAYDPPCRPAR